MTSVVSMLEGEDAVAQSWVPELIPIKTIEKQGLVRIVYVYFPYRGGVETMPKDLSRTTRPFEISVRCYWQDIYIERSIVLTERESEGLFKNHSVSAPRKNHHCYNRVLALVFLNGGFQLNSHKTELFVEDPLIRALHSDTAWGKRGHPLKDLETKITEWHALDEEGHFEEKDAQCTVDIGTGPMMVQTWKWFQSSCGVRVYKGMEIIYANEVGARGRLRVPLPAKVVSIISIPHPQRGESSGYFECEDEFRLNRFFIQTANVTWDKMKADQKNNKPANMKAAHKKLKELVTPVKIWLESASLPHRGTDENMIEASKDKSYFMISKLDMPNSLVSHTNFKATQEIFKVERGKLTSVSKEMASFPGKFSLKFTSPGEYRIRYTVVQVPNGVLKPSSWPVEEICVRVRPGAPCALRLSHISDRSPAGRVPVPTVTVKMIRDGTSLPQLDVAVMDSEGHRINDLVRDKTRVLKLRCNIKTGHGPDRCIPIDIPAKNHQIYEDMVVLPGPVISLDSFPAGLAFPVQAELVCSWEVQLAGMMAYRERREGEALLGYEIAADSEMGVNFVKEFAAVEEHASKKSLQPMLVRELTLRSAPLPIQIYSGAAKSLQLVPTNMFQHSLHPGKFKDSTDHGENGMLVVLDDKGRKFNLLPDEERNFTERRLFEGLLTVSVTGDSDSGRPPLNVPMEIVDGGVCMQLANVDPGVGYGAKGTFTFNVKRRNESGGTLAKSVASLAVPFTMISRSIRFHLPNGIVAEESVKNLCRLKLPRHEKLSGVEVRFVDDASGDALDETIGKKLKFEGAGSNKSDLAIQKGICKLPDIQVDGAMTFKITYKAIAAELRITENEELATKCRFAVLDIRVGVPVSVTVQFMDRFDRVVPPSKVDLTQWTAKVSLDLSDFPNATLEVADGATANTTVPVLLSGSCTKDSLVIPDVFKLSGKIPDSGRSAKSVKYEFTASLTRPGVEQAPLLWNGKAPVFAGPLFRFAPSKGGPVVVAENRDVIPDFEVHAVDEYGNKLRKEVLADTAVQNVTFGLPKSLQSGMVTLEPASHKVDRDLSCLNISKMRICVPALSDPEGMPLELVTTLLCGTKTIAVASPFRILVKPSTKPALIELMDCDGTIIINSLPFFEVRVLDDAMRPVADTAIVVQLAISNVSRRQVTETGVLSDSARGVYRFDLAQVLTLVQKPALYSAKVRVWAGNVKRDAAVERSINVVRHPGPPARMCINPNKSVGRKATPDATPVKDIKLWLEDAVGNRLVPPEGLFLNLGVRKECVESVAVTITIHKPNGETFKLPSFTANTDGHVAVPWVDFGHLDLELFPTIFSKSIFFEGFSVCNGVHLTASLQIDTDRDVTAIAAERQRQQVCLIPPRLLNTTSAKDKEAAKRKADQADARQNEISERAAELKQLEAELNDVRKTMAIIDREKAQLNSKRANKGRSTDAINA
eukprot:Opistho-2@84190